MEIEKAMSKCSLFKGISPSNYDYMKELFSFNICSYEKNSLIFDSNNIKAGFVLEGLIELSLYDESDNVLSIAHLKCGDIFGAAIKLLSRRCANISMKALRQSSVVFMNIERIKDDVIPINPLYQRVCVNLLTLMAEKNFFMNYRLRIVAQKKIRDKIKVYLKSVISTDGETFILPYSRNELAAFLYVDRSALSRELGRMKEEGIIEYNGNIIKLLDNGFLSF